MGENQPLHWRGCPREDARLPCLSLLSPPGCWDSFLFPFLLSLFLCFYIYLEIIFTIMCHQLCNPLIKLHTCELVSTSFVQKCHRPARANLSSLHSRIFWERSLSLSPSEAVPLSFKKFKILSIMKREALKSYH